MESGLFRCYNVVVVGNGFMRNVLNACSILCIVVTGNVTSRLRAQIVTGNTWAGFLIVTTML